MQKVTAKKQKLSHQVRSLGAAPAVETDLESIPDIALGRAIGGMSGGDVGWRCTLPVALGKTRTIGDE